MGIISKELAALDAVIEGASALALEALHRKADLKQGKLASEAYGRVNTAVKVRLESRLNQGRMIEMEAKLIEQRNREDKYRIAGRMSSEARADTAGKETPSFGGPERH